jgi:two-component system, NtrC family, nitrogen regulation sensor histidine kinase NtrY
MSANKNTTFRFPFDINPNFFLGLALLFFILTIKPINSILFPRVTPTTLKPKIEKYIVNNVKLFKEVYADTNLIHSIINQKINPYQFEKTKTLPFALFVYQKENIIFWNTNNIAYPTDTFQVDKLSTYEDNTGFFVVYKHKISPQISCVMFLKIKSNEPTSDEKFKKYFLVSDNENDFGIQIVNKKNNLTVPVNFRGDTMFYLEKNDDYFRINDSNGWRMFFNMLPFIFFGISIHTYFKVTIKKNNILKIYGLLWLSIILIRLLTYYAGFPTNYDEFTMFSPEIFASNKFNKSLGDLFINMSLLFWATLFFAINVQGEFNEKNYIKLKGFTIFILVIISSINVYLSSLITSLINDSVINFDTTLISQIDIFSMVGLLTILIIFANIFIFNYIAFVYFKNCFKKESVKYLISILIFIVLAVIFHNSYLLAVLYAGTCSIIYFLLHDSKYFKIKLDFNSYTLLVWIMVVALCGAIYLTIIINSKEVLNRKNFAEKLIEVNDKKLESNLSKYKTVINEDGNLLQKLNKIGITENEIVKYLYQEYLNAQFSYYKKTLRFVLAPGVNNKSEESYISEIENLKIELHNLFNFSADSSVCQFQSFNENGYLLSFKVENNSKTLGYFFLKLSKKNNIIEKDYSDFLYPNSSRNKVKEYNYSIAMYEDDIFEFRIGSHEFPFQLSQNEIKDFNEKDYFVKRSIGSTQLWYKGFDNNKIVVISKESNFFYLLSMLFAYIFFIYFLVFTLYILGNIIARSNLKYSRFLNLLSLNLRLRIHAAILMVVLLSFFAVGYFTYQYLINRVKNKANSEISNYSQLILFKINNYYLEANDKIEINNSDINFEKFLIDEANKYAKGINIFDINNGSMIYTSQPDFFNSNIISDKVPYEVLMKLKNSNIEHILNKEQINGFKYVSMYSFIKNPKGGKIAILQLPYFSSEQEAKDETTTILITLINIYVFVFLLSSIIALLISNSVTKPFKYIVKQFTKINLAKTNEPLKWNNSDEIGLLVKEYNRMLRKLENSTVLLAKSEREMAWREMAKQVAHEIKNPLTPMKLSMQMLEKAIKNKKPNVAEMTERVTATIIEQIDNLTLIATNFSNFAKMPELQKEVVILNEVLYAVTGMYIDDKDNEFLFLVPNFPIYIYADKSQLIRVFTNIIQNAIQAIPENRKGNISLSVTKIENNFVRVTVSDNGEGISTEKAKNLFQPYFTTKSSGTGLGLAMCKDIIEKFGGSITYESIVDKGAQFYIDLPIHTEHDFTE